MKRPSVVLDSRRHNACKLFRFERYIRLYVHNRRTDSVRRRVSRVVVVADRAVYGFSGALFYTLYRRLRRATKRVRTDLFFRGNGLLLLETRFRKAERNNRLNRRFLNLCRTRMTPDDF